MLAERNEPHVHLSLVVPLYNAESFVEGTARRVGDFLSGLPYSCEIIFVDDGSCDATFARTNRIASEIAGIRFLAGRRNQGKGACVGDGFRAARGSYLVFIDVDLAYPLEQVAEIVALLEKGADLAVACRVHPDSRYIVRPGFFPYLFTRHLMSRFFNLLVRALFVPGIWDTQAGLKGFRREAAEAIFSRQTLFGFSFDVEVFYVARKLGLRIRQIAVDYRYDSETTTVSFFLDAMRMLRDLARIRLNDIRGGYDAPIGNFKSSSHGRREADTGSSR